MASVKDFGDAYPEGNRRARAESPVEEQDHPFTTFSYTNALSEPKGGSSASS